MGKIFGGLNSNVIYQLLYTQCSGDPGSDGDLRVNSKTKKDPSHF